MRISVRPIVWVLALVGLGATVLWAAEPPYVGDWKLNPAKSDFGETTVTYEEMASGQMKVTSDGQSYTFKADGEDYPTPWGNSSSWKALDANSWEVMYKTDGKVVSTGTLKLGADGKTLTANATNIKATGETSNDSAVYQRVSGGPGLAGKWKTQNLKIGSPGTLSIRPAGTDGLTLTYVEEKGICEAKLDGKDYPATGPIWPSGWTCAIAKSDVALEVTWKKDGKVMSKDALSVSADGKTLTDLSSAAGTTEKVKLVYDRR